MRGLLRRWAAGPCGVHAWQQPEPRSPGRVRPTAGAKQELREQPGERFTATDILGQIEEVGWHLEHVGYVFVETGEVARSKVMSSGLVSRTQGYVEGIYLFRRVPKSQ